MAITKFSNNPFNCEHGSHQPFGDTGETQCTGCGALWRTTPPAPDAKPDAMGALRQKVEVLISDAVEMRRIWRIKEEAFREVLYQIGKIDALTAPPREGDGT